MEKGDSSKAKVYIDKDFQQWLRKEIPAMSLPRLVNELLFQFRVSYRSEKDFPSMMKEAVDLTRESLNE
jgi:hypothetical protein